MQPQRAYTDALEKALGAIVADARRQVQTYQLQADAVIASLNARVIETETRLASLEAHCADQVEKRLASLRDGVDVDMDVVNARIDAAIAKIPAPKDGKDADPETVKEMVAAAVSEIPTPKDGKDVDMEKVDHMIAEAVFALPAPKDGKDADPELIRAIVAETIAATPLAEASRDDLHALLRGMVVAAVADIPEPKDGEDGKDADPEVVQSMVAEAVSALPAPKDGKDVDPDEIVSQVLNLMPSKEELRGPSGCLPVVLSWENRVYYEGDVVTFGGGTYQAVCDTGQSPEHKDWSCLARPGTKGDGFVARGTFSKEELYEAGDVVQWNGGSWCAKYDDPGDCPGDGWQLWAGVGKKGDKGPRGDRGPAGADGASFVSASADDQGMVTFIMSNGQTLQLDLYPMLKDLR